MNEKSIISVDCETNSLNPVDAELVGISFGCDTNEAYYIPVAHNSFKCLGKEYVIKKIKKFLKIQVLKKLVKNIKYDFIVFINMGLI